MGVDTWNEAPTVTEDVGWKPDDAAAALGGWGPDVAGDEETFTGEFASENISKHANGNDSGCRICGQDAHFARDCPDRKPNVGGCFNFGEEGHNKADCPNPRVVREFTGECRLCNEVGHRAAECPQKPASTCKLCKQEGHMAAECNANRVMFYFAGFGVEDLSVEDAWKAVEEADKEKEVDDIRKAILAYAKAFPEVTFEELESVFREAGMNTYLIAKEQAVSDTHTIVNLQGKIDQKYAISIQFGAKPRRAKFAEGWPDSPEENNARLTEAGFVMDRMVMKCSNCDQLGHRSKTCPEEKREREQRIITCANCNEAGHYARDCREKRKNGKRGCKNCGSEDHMVKECPEPPNPDNVECRNCGQTGHFSRQCPDKAPEVCRNCGEEGHRAKECEKERVFQCRNCDEYGHKSRECTKPTDWSRVECSNCHEKGHSYKRCTQPPKESDGDAEGAAGGGWGGDAAGISSGGGDWGANEVAADTSNGSW